MKDSCVIAAILHANKNHIRLEIRNGQGEKNTIELQADDLMLLSRRQDKLNELINLLRNDDSSKPK